MDPAVEHRRRGALCASREDYCCHGTRCTLVRARRVFVLYMSTGALRQRITINNLPTPVCLCAFSLATMVEATAVGIPAYYATRHIIGNTMTRNGIEKNATNKYRFILKTGRSSGFHSASEPAEPDIAVHAALPRPHQPSHTAGDGQCGGTPLARRGVPIKLRGVAQGHIGPAQPGYGAVLIRR